jgi:membrane dipeptidase
MQSWIDGHLDLAYIHQVCGDVRRAAATTDNRCVSLPALREGGFGIVAATIFVEPGRDAAAQPWGYNGHDDLAGAQRAALAQLAIYESFEREGLLRIIRTAVDLRAPGPLGIVLLMEGADAIADAADAARWHARGIRMCGLTWAEGTRHAGGNAAGGGLSASGREIVAAFDELGILHDASHLSDAAFDDLLAHTARRVVASHSNARALLGGGQRHINDAQIREVARRGGVIGLNLYGKFLASQRSATIDDALAHIEHIASVAATRAVCALGSDFDGGFAPTDIPEGLRSPQQVQSLRPLLRAREWTDAECNGFAHGNWFRVIEESLAASDRGGDSAAAKAHHRAH